MILKKISQEINFTAVHVNRQTRDSNIFAKDFNSMVEKYEKLKLAFEFSL